MHRNDLESLHIHNIDLHYHAGQERQQGTTLEGYLDHATLTGRIILGITDHLEKYIGKPLSPVKGKPLYEQSAQGLQSFRSDVDNMKRNFSSLELFFGLEIHAGPKIDVLDLPSRVIEVSDYFLVSLPDIDASISENTQAKIEQIDLLARMRERTGKPVYICHPFRSAVDKRLVKQPVPPWVTSMNPKPIEDITDEEVNRFFCFNVREIGKACRQYSLPLEINGGTDSRIRGLNLPSPLQLYWASYDILSQEGVTFVPGSDQHAYMRTPTRREGRYIPFDCFDRIGVKARDVLFVKNLLENRFHRQERSLC